MTFLETIITQFSSFVSNINPVVLEIIKIFAVSFGWIGGLAFFMWTREQNKNKKEPLLHTTNLNISEAA